MEEERLESRVGSEWHECSRLSVLTAVWTWWQRERASLGWTCQMDLPDRRICSRDGASTSRGTSLVPRGCWMPVWFGLWAETWALRPTPVWTAQPMSKGGVEPRSMWAAACTASVAVLGSNPGSAPATCETPGQVTESKFHRAPVRVAGALYTLLLTECTSHMFWGSCQVECWELPQASIEGLLGSEKPFSMDSSEVTVQDWLLQHCGQGLLTCGHRSLGNLIKCRFRFRRSGWAWEPGFLTSSQEILLLVVLGPHFEM